MSVLFVAALLLISPGDSLSAEPAKKIKVILDTDIGSDVDDAYALALVASLPEAELLGVTTAFEDGGKRAQMAAKLLQVMGRGEVPVAAGRNGKDPIGRQWQWAKGFQSKAIQKDDAVEFLAKAIGRHPGEVTLVPVGPLTNIGDLFSRHPEVKGQIQRIVIMGGSVYAGYNDRPPPVKEYNIECDPKAAQAVFSSGVPLAMAGLEVTAMMKLEKEMQRRLCAHGEPLTDALAALTLLWGQEVPTLYDPVAAAYALGHAFSESEEKRVEVSGDGMTCLAEGAPNATVLVKPRKGPFLEWYIQALAPVRQ
ncbi:MAG: nucleoside hydrolase [Planctomycetes bacterium]|nr:nucleoside hydrolase [Planctomycetota bacterium]